MMLIRAEELARMERRRLAFAITCRETDGERSNDP